MDDAGPPEPEAASEKKRPLLRRVPTALVVTLLGIGLTAWLLPAVTRQWDDRQKAHQLQASLVTEIASATASALTEIRDSTFQANSRPTPSAVVLRLGVRPLSPIERAWSVETLQIEAKLRAYFPQSPVSFWRLFATYVGVMIADSTGRAIVTVHHQTGFLGGLSPAESYALFRPPFSDELPLLGAFEDSIGTYRDDERTHATAGRTAKDARSVLNAYQTAASELLVLEETVAASILGAHVKGYSTTWQDLVHDLIP